MPTHEPWMDWDAGAVLRAPFDDAPATSSAEWREEMRVAAQASPSAATWLAIDDLARHGRPFPDVSSAAARRRVRRLAMKLGQAK